MPVQMKIDFYRVEMPSGCTATFESILKAVHRSASDESRNFMIRDYPVRLQESHLSHECIEGDLMKIRMNALPPKASLGGDVGPLNLEEDEGLGEETAFLYEPRTQVLALQRNRFGVSYSALAAYFQERGKLDKPIYLRPILQADAYARLAKMKEVRRLEIGFAGVTNPKAFGSGGAVGGFVDILNAFRAPCATVALSMGRLPGSLFMNRIRTLGKEVLGLTADTDGEVTKLEVSGISDDDEKDVFDLLAYRMVESADVDENKNRRTTYSRRRPHVLAAWNRRRSELSRLYG